MNIGNAAASSVEAGAVTLNGGSQVTIGDLTAHNAVVVDNAGTLLQLLGDYSQSAGDFRLSGAATFDVNGTFNKTGAGEFHLFGGSTFDIGVPAASSIEAGAVTVRTGYTVSIGELTAHDNVDITENGTLVHVLGDYMQDGGFFAINFGGDFDVDGTFIKTGTGGFFLVGGGSFEIGNPAASSVEAGAVTVRTGYTVSIGELTAHDNVDITENGTLVHVLGDYMQDGGFFAINFGGDFDVDGTFIKTGTGGFFLVGGGSFEIGNPAASSIEAGDTHIDTGTVTLGDFIARGNFDVNNPGVLVHLLGDYQQTNGQFHVFQNATVRVDGTFTKTGTGPFIIDSGGSLVLTNPAASSIEAGDTHIDTGT
ncbi:MAG: hypothetical protein WD669_06320, partial [Pirellulales bacterium]